MKRRTFLKGVSGACVAAPFLGSVHEQWAKAQGMPTAPPKRLVIMYTHNGCLTEKWFPKKASGELLAADLTDSYLNVLGDISGKLLIPRGFKSLNPYALGGQSIDPHDQACGSKLTCAPISESRDRYAMAESLDHTIAKQINPNQGAPLVLGVGAASKLIKEVISFSGPEQAFPSNVNPQTVYQQITGVLSPGGGGPVTPADYLVAKGQSAIDLVRDDLATYQRLNMSTADKGRIQDWLDLLRDTETGVNGPDMALAACTRGSADALGAIDAAVTAASPTGPITAGNVLGPRGSAEGDANLAISMTLGTDMMQNLMALQMMCDMNRVLLLVFPGYIIFNWDGIQHTHEAHGLSHRTGDFTVGGACGVNGVLDMLGEIDTWYTSKYNRMVRLFDSLGEGEAGQTLLDNTATMWLPELSDGAAHNINNLPIIIAGSCGGYLKTGAIVNVENGTPDNGKSTSTCQNGGSIGNTGSSGGNVPINKLYVTLMNAVGCTENGGKVTKFGQGDASSATGGITNPGEVASLTAAG